MQPSFCFFCDSLRHDLCKGGEECVEAKPGCWILVARTGIETAPARSTKHNEHDSLNIGGENGYRG